MEFQCNLLLYLDKRRFLDDMKNECEKFFETELKENAHKSPPLRYLLEIDIMDLQDTFPELAELLLKEPLVWRRISNIILFACLQSTRDEVIEIVQPEQVAAIVRIKSLSKLMVPPNKKQYSGIVTFEGILLSVSKPAIYVYHTVWSCPEECDGSKVILQFIPKVPRKCYMCRSILFENAGLRRCGEQVKAAFKLTNMICPKVFNISDDLVPRLALGSKYFIHGIVTKKLTEILSLEEILPLPAPITSSVPKNIQELFNTCDGVPWKFIYCLASCIGYDICPLSCFMHLKISLLVSLCSVKANQITGSNIVHVLVTGLDTSYVGDIMTDAAHLADESISLGTSNTTVSTALIASSGGICVMPLPLYSYNPRQISLMLAAIESGEVKTDTGKADLQSAVWAQGTDYKKIIVLNVANVFGTICRGDTGEYTDEIAEYVLQRSMEPVETNEEGKEALKELTLYIDLVAGLEVVLDDSTESLLRNYFLAARKERLKSILVGSMKALVAMCVTSAKLCRRNIAGIDDAVLAIWLHVSGATEPRLAPEEYLRTPPDVKNLNKMMTNFKEWLEKFTGTILL